jgi:hypothetical protein
MSSGIASGNVAVTVLKVLDKLHAIREGRTEGVGGAGAVSDVAAGSRHG